MKDKNAIQNMSTKALLDELETRGIKFRTVPVQPNDTPEFIGQMVDIVEDFLEEKGVIIDNPEKEDEPDEATAIIYGSDYDNLAEQFKGLMKSHHCLTETDSHALVSIQENDYGAIYEPTYIGAGLFHFYLLKRRAYKDGTFSWKLCCELAENFDRYMIIDHIRGTKEEALERLEKIVSTGKLPE